MRRVLVVAPHFAPVSAPDGQRARMSARHFSEYGWEPHILTVAADDQEAVRDEDLARTLPVDLRVTAVPAWAARSARRVGIGNVAIRAIGSLYREGRDIIRDRRIDLVYFSTTMFASMPLGRLWKRSLGVPFVIDIQDPWVSDYEGPRGHKAALARLMHGYLEPYTMRDVDGLIAVSEDYITTLRRRYPWIAADRCATIPFGASSGDMEAARALPWANRFFDVRDGRLHGVAVGRGGDDMATAARILFRGTPAFVLDADARRRPVNWTFVGTDYAPPGRGRRTIFPIAVEEGAGSSTVESTDRVPYLDGLRLLCDASFLVVLGSDDTQYSPSKVYPYLLAGRPILALLHERSPVVDLLRRADCGLVVTFASPADVDRGAAQLAERWPAFVARVGRPWAPPPAIVREFSARELTRRQCELFDRIVGGPAAGRQEVA